MKTHLNIFFLFIISISFAQNKKEIDSLAHLYYYDFISPTVKLNHDFIDLTGDIEKDSITKLGMENFEKNIIKKSIYYNSAELALENFLKLWNIEPESRENIYYPIKQLGCYLKKDLNYIELPKCNAFFPNNQFTYFKQNWECDYSINYLFEIECSKKESDFLKLQLVNLNESNLNTIKIDNSVSYRFTWLRTFHHPIVIRIENINEEYFLYWKVGKGAGGYKPKGLLKEGKRKITVKEWEVFETLISHEDFLQSQLLGCQAHMDLFFLKNNKCLQHDFESFPS